VLITTGGKIGEIVGKGWWEELLRNWEGEDVVEGEPSSWYSL